MSSEAIYLWKFSWKYMNKRPFITLSFIVFTIAINFLIPTFDNSLYGVEGHPAKWLSFMPAEPLRSWGGSLILSPFLHLNLKHLFINLIFFVPLGMMIERKNSGPHLALCILIIHVEVLLLLIITHFFWALDGKAFLGLSHIIMGLFSYWAIMQKKYFMLVLVSAVITYSQWQTENPLTLIAHGLGLVAGFELFVLGHLWEKSRS